MKLSSNNKTQPLEFTSSLETFGRDILNDLYYSGEGLLDPDGFIDRWMERAEELGLLEKAKAVKESEYSYLWLRTFVAGGEIDRQRLLSEGEIAIEGVSVNE